MLKATVESIGAGHALSLHPYVQWGLRDAKGRRLMSGGKWNYFNGRFHGWNGPNGYVPPVPMTLCYCSECGPKLIPGFDVSPDKEGRGHWKTDFSTANWHIGKPCNGCGVDL